MKWGAKVSRAIQGTSGSGHADVAGCCLVQEWRVQHLLKLLQSSQGPSSFGLSLEMVIIFFLSPLLSITPFKTMFASHSMF